MRSSMNQAQTSTVSNEVAGERKEITSICEWMAEEGPGCTARKEAMSYRGSILGNM